MGCNGFVLKLKIFECFVNKIELPWCCVVFFVVCLLLRSIYFSASYRYLDVLRIARMFKLFTCNIPTK